MYINVLISLAVLLRFGATKTRQILKWYRKWWKVNRDIQLNQAITFILSTELIDLSISTQECCFEFQLWLKTQYNIFCIQIWIWIIRSSRIYACTKPSNATNGKEKKIISTLLSIRTIRDFVINDGRYLDRITKVWFIIKIESCWSMTLEGFEQWNTASFLGIIIYIIHYVKR